MTSVVAVIVKNYRRGRSNTARSESMTQIRRFHHPHLIIAFGLLLGGGSAWGATPEITEATACTAVVSAFDAKDAAAIRGVAGVTLRVMDTVDSDYAAKGAPSVSSKWNDDGIKNAVAATAAICQDNDGWTLRQAAVEAYEELRAIYGALR
jgi:hypothetical protein